MCGVLTLEMGIGSGTYKHAKPVVHGLWPQQGNFGNSQCVEPQFTAAPMSLPACYQSTDEHSRAGQQLAFVKHEWQKHGTCAGTENAHDFFAQVCNLAKGPLQLMESARTARMDLVQTADQLQRSAFCVYDLGSNQQIQLSACAGLDGQWKLADVDDFANVCSSKLPTSPHPKPPAGDELLGCVEGHRGPSCDSDSDCKIASGCLRCARSGYCTAASMTTAFSRRERR